MHPHSIADYAHAFAWLMLIPGYALLFGVGHWIAELVHAPHGPVFLNR